MTLSCPSSGNSQPSTLDGNFHSQILEVAELVDASAAAGSRDLLTALPEMPQLVAAVEGGDFIALRQRRIIEDGVDEIVDRRLEGDRHLADVDQLGGAGAD